MKPFFLLNKINELFPPDFSTKNFNTCLEYAKSCYHFSKFSHDFDFSGLIDYLASNFCLIEEEKFLKRPNLIQYLIISNPKLQIHTEDSLFDIVNQIINNETSEEKGNTERIDSI